MAPRLGADQKYEYLGSNKNDRLAGTAANDHFYGGNGDDVFLGMGGFDTYEGGYGFDIVDFSWAVSRIAINLSQTGYRSQQNTGAGGYAIIFDIEGIIGSRFDDDLRGFLADNRLDGGDGNDYLFGDPGADTLIGGTGNDTLQGGTGNDSLLGGTGNDKLEGQTENDYLAGDAGNDWMSGGAGNDTLLGGDGNDTLIGGAGVDYVDGGNGTDLVTFDDATKAIILDLRPGASSTNDALGDRFANVEQFKLSWQADRLFAGNEAVRVYGGHGQDLLNGGGGNDMLFGDGDPAPSSGSENNDTINGGAGDDTLVGGSGADLMDGGPGRDTISYVDAPAAVHVNMGDPTGSSNKGDAWQDRHTNAERLELSPHADTYVAGSVGFAVNGAGGNDTLNGGIGNDSLFGGAGADRMVGGLGADAYEVDDKGDIVLELPDGGVDLVYANIDYQLPNNIENGASIATVGIVLLGNGLDNILTGGVGNDTLSGGLGKDSLAGGLGIDVYRYLSVEEVDGDTITGFIRFGNHADVIDLSAIDARRGVAGDQAFTLIGTAKFSAEGQIRVTGVAGGIQVELNVDNDLAADATFIIAGLGDLRAGDFIL